MKSVQQMIVALACAGMLAGCKDGGTGPGNTSYAVIVQSGNGQFGARNATLAEPLQVLVTDPNTRKPQKGITVEWSIVQGTGAALTTTTSTTNSVGVASTQLKLGDIGTYAVQATVARIQGAAPKFTARAVDAPSITTVLPTAVRAGDTITITGQNFSTTPDENAVLFGGFRGQVVSATATQLRVVVPVCIPTRGITVQANLGAVAGNQVSLTVSGTSVNTIQLVRGQVSTFSEANAMGCFRMPGDVANASLLLVPQNVSQLVGSIMPYEIAGLTAANVSASAREVNILSASEDFASGWELGLRMRERAMIRTTSTAVAARPEHALVASCTSSPKVGDRCDFQVSNKDDKFETITAEVKVVSARAILYQDINAPANGLTAADFAYLGAVFDDPIYATDVATWGPPSDIDSNQKVIILLTPVVNSLTPRGTNGYIAGFFYACDLLPRSSCSGTNRGEMFYGFTADAAAQFGDARSRETVTRALPAILAHEFQHMINFSQRGNNTADDLWLSEGMAHHAEDVVGDVFEARGDLATATLIKAQNTLRGNRFLRAIASTSLLSEDDASLELRGGAWLFVKYLQGRFGTPILQKLTRTTLSGVANVTSQTGMSWSSLLADWAVALWADDAPELAGVAVNNAYSFPGVNLRTRLANSDGSYPIKPAVYNFADFIHRETLQASSESYIIVNGAAAPNVVNLGFSGQRGGPFAAGAVPQISVMRIR